MSSKISAKPARGTRDLFPGDVYLRNSIFRKLVPLYEKYGGKPVQTSILERMDIVNGLYGEEFDKLVFTLDGAKQDDPLDQSEKLLLRYDLTVPFARFIANNGIVVYRRYQIGPVYRKDNVNINKGRLREFYQADFDIIGSDTDMMIQETEILNLLIECLDSLISNDTYKIYINSREILFDLLSVIGIDGQLCLPVCSTLDKLDKMCDEEWEARTKTELTEKNVPIDKIASILKFIGTFRNSSKSNAEKLTELKDSGYIKPETFDKMIRLFGYLDSTGISNYIVFSPTLSRGLDYYTGLIFEATYNDKQIMESSIAAGGRYNNLIDKLSNKKSISAIGVSIGIERIVTILEKKGVSIDQPVPMVFVASVGKDMVGERLKLVCQLRKQGIYAEMNHSSNPKMKVQLDKVLEDQIPYMIVIGENEIQKNTVTLKNINTKVQTELDRNEAIQFLKQTSQKSQ